MSKKAETSTPAGRRSTGRLVALAAAGIVALLVVALSIAPTLLSTAFGRGLILDAANRSVQGTLDIESLELSWFGPQQATAITLRHPDGTEVARVDAFQTELGLFDAIRGHLPLGLTRVETLRINLAVDSDGSHNLAEALAPSTPPAQLPQSSSDEAIVLPFTGNLEIIDGFIKVTAPGISVVEVDDLNASLTMTSLTEPIHFGVRAMTRQAELEGRLAVDGVVQDLFSANGAVRPTAARGEIKIDIEDLPVDSLDAVLGLDGWASVGLGEALSVSIEGSGDLDQQSLAVAARSGRAHLEFAGSLTPSQFELTAPATLEVEITPTLTEKILAGGTERDGSPAPRLRQAVSVAMAVERLRIPYAAGDWSSTNLDVLLSTQDSIVFEHIPELGTVRVDGLLGEARSEALSDTLALSFDAAIDATGTPGQLNIRAELSNLLDEAGAFNPDSAKMDGKIEIAELPTLIVDRVAGLNGFASKVLGPRLSLSADVASGTDTQLDATISLTSDNLTVAPASVAIGETLSLTTPFVATFQLSPEGFAVLPGTDPVRLDRAVPLKIEISEFSLPRPGTAEAVSQALSPRIDGTIESGPVALSGVPELGVVEINEGSIRVETEPDGAIGVSTTGRFDDFQHEWLQALLGSPTRFGVKTSLPPRGSEAPSETLPLDLSLQSDGLRLDAGTRIDTESMALTLTRSARVDVVVTPALMQLIEGESDEGVRLSASTELQLEVTDLAMALSPFEHTQTLVSGQLRGDEISVLLPSLGRDTTLSATRVDFSYQGSEDAGTIDFGTRCCVGEGEEPGQLEATIRAGNLFANGVFDAQQATLDAQAMVSMFPTEFLALALGQDVLTDLVGPAVNLTASATQSGQGTPSEISVSVNGQSQHTDFQTVFTLGETLALTQPASLQWTLTPDGFKSLQQWLDPESGAQATELGLTENLSAELNVETLRWPLSAVALGDTAARQPASVDAVLQIPRIAVRADNETSPITLESLEARITSTNLSEATNVAFSAVMPHVPNDPAGPTGQVSLAASAQRLLNDKGEWVPDEAGVQAQFEAIDLPVPLIDAWLDLNALGTETLGDVLNISGETDLLNMSGPVSLSINGPFAKASINGEMTPNELTLTSPLVAELRITEQLGRAFLSKIHPIFETVRESQQPVRLEISDQGFLLPITGARLEDISIPELTLDFGQLTLGNGWLLDGTIALAQQFGVLDATERETWSAWFTPLLLEMQNGRVSYRRRLDLLLDDRLHLSTWGSADLAEEKINMTFALMPDTLNSLFGLSVAPGDALRMPISGSLSAPRVDFGRATVDLGRIRSQRRLSDKDPLLGAVVGALGNAAVGEPVPLPSVDPLPWPPPAPVEVPPESAESSGTETPAQPDPAQPERPKSLEEQAVEGLFDLLRKRN